MDAPDDLDERLKFEAEYFIGQDSEIEIVKPIEKHLSRVIIGDESAIIIDKLLKKYNIRFVSSSGNRDESVIGSYANTYAIAKTHGEKCLDFIFSIIRNIGWDNEPNGYATFVMRSIKKVRVAHPDDRKKIHSYLSKNLRQIDLHLFSANARVAYPKRDTRAACILYLEDMLCSDIGLERKIYQDGDRKCKVMK